MEARVDGTGLNAPRGLSGNRGAPLPQLGPMGEAIRRLQLAGQPAPHGVKGPALRRLVGELSSLAEPIRRMRTRYVVAQAEHSRPVMLLPGFGTHPTRMGYMKQKLEDAGHRVTDWGVGWNFGPRRDKFRVLRDRIVDLAAVEGEPLVLVGWSLGGIIAREVARRHPGQIALVITMGTPFSGDLHANNAWRLYQAIAGHAVDEPPIRSAPHEKPPVPTVALWSARDGIVSPRSSCGRPGERDRAVALRCTHLGFANTPEAISAVLTELDRARPAQ